MKLSPRRACFLFSTLVLLLLPGAARATDTEPIRVGASISLSGTYTEPSAMIRDGYRLWAEQVNERGGLLGRPVDLILRDDHSDPDSVRAIYHALVDDEKVDLVLSPYGTPLTLEASEVTEKAGMVMLACAAAGKAVWERGYRYVFGMYVLGDRYFIGLLDLMARHGMRTVAVLHEDNPFNNDVADGAVQWADRFGLAVARNTAFTPGRDDLAPLLADLADADPDGLIVSCYPPAGYQVLDGLTRLAWRPRALALTIIPTHPDFLTKAGPIGEGVFAPSQWEPDERIPYPGTTRFVADFQAAYGRLPSYHAGSAYASCQILEQAIRHVQAIDQRRIREYVMALDTVTVIGRFKVDHAGRQVGHNPILVQWQDGRKEIVYPTKMQTAEPRFGPPGEKRP